MTDQHSDSTVDAEAGDAGIDVLTLIRETQLAQAAELKVIKGS